MTQRSNYGRGNFLLFWGGELSYYLYLSFLQQFYSIRKKDFHILNMHIHRDCIYIYKFMPLKTKLGIISLSDYLDVKTQLAEM